jgi:uncharacterized hydrophobic protein (TIGR00271 family)
MLDDPTADLVPPTPLGPFSARSDPAWLNQATIKGVVLVLAGAAMPVVTRDSDQFASAILGVVLIAWAASEFWFRVVRRTGPRHVAALAVPMSLLVGGVVLIVDPGPALSVILGVTLATRGLVLVADGLRGVPSSPAALARGVVLFVVAVLMVLLPETFVLGLRALAGGAAVLIGGVLVATGLGPKDEQELLELDAHGVRAVASEWLRDRHVDPTQAEDISETLFFEAPNRRSKLASFWVMMCLATSIATFAVIQDSTAVVIGAMLVAPLMTPIMGVAAGIVNGWPARMAASLALAVAAVVVAIALAWVIAAWLPSVGDLAENSQITSRISPNLLDLCIAVAAGAAGAYATVDPRVSSSLSGVAIAVALVPPLAVVGITLEAGAGGDAFGAFLLFLTNFVSIILAGSVVLVLTGFARLTPSDRESEHQWRILGPVLVGASLIVVPLSLTSFDIWEDSNNVAAAETAVEEWLGDGRDITVVLVEVDDDDVRLVLTGSEDPPSIGDLKSALESELALPVELSVRMVPSDLLAVP